MNIQWKYNVHTKELTLKISPVKQTQFSTILHVLNDIAKKGLIEGEYVFDTPPS